eukprot:TRINITY_DN1319_c0_g1_i2.p1 TRINITY_DN1319_c0_g1~~TRINITY_DN1319_c0_g1_i2.p1  ORF type:complete len:376 (+),score=68.08 TRINITY_DN1319_c0_g1_i2:59-1186(+)
MQHTRSPLLWTCAARPSGHRTSMAATIFNTTTVSSLLRTTRHFASSPAGTTTKSTNKARSPRILVTGALGQIGTELVPELRKLYGATNVIASDMRRGGKDEDDDPFVYIDITQFNDFERVVVEQRIDWLVHNASILSAAGELNPSLAIKVNFEGLNNALEVGRRHGLRVFAPSSIAGFGPTTPLDNTPNTTIMQPTTIYGISKVYGELMGSYYHTKWGLDFRSVRYPGIISSVAPPGGGTTDYAVDIFYKALQTGKFNCFLRKDSMLPMMYMPDCLRATIGILAAPPEQLKERTYNVAAVSFTPEQLAAAIRKHIPKFEISYQPDFRQAIADSWPRSLDDKEARLDWHWNHQYGLDAMVKDMLDKLRIKLAITNL